jgi:hypothetical protein
MAATAASDGVAKAWTRAVFAPPPATASEGVYPVSWTEHVRVEVRPWLVTVAGTSQPALNGRRGVHVDNRGEKNVVVLDPVNTDDVPKFIAVLPEKLVYGFHGFEGGAGGNGKGAASVVEGSGGSAAPTMEAVALLTEQQEEAMALAETIVVTAAPEMPPADGYVPHEEPDNTNSSHGNGYRDARRRNRRLDGIYSITFDKSSAKDKQT